MTTILDLLDFLFSDGAAGQGCPRAQHVTSLCVLIPAYNEEKVIQAGIWSACQSGFLPRDIFIVDDGSTDSTSKAALALGVNILRVANAGRAEALNSGIRGFRLMDRYDYIAVMDADTKMDAGYRITMLEAIGRHPTVAAFAGTPRSIKHNWLTAYRTLEYAISCGIYKEAQHLFHSITVCPGPASVYKASLFLEVTESYVPDGYFFTWRERTSTTRFSAKTLAEDMDITIDMTRKGHRVAYVPDALVHTQDPPTLRGYIGQVARWQRGVWQNVRKHRLGRQRQPIDFEFAYLCTEGLVFAVVLVLLPLWCWWSPWVTGAAFVLDQAMFLSLALMVATRQKRWDVLVAFPLFTVPRLLNTLIFAYMFLAERRPREAKWFSVERY